MRTGDVRRLESKLRSSRREYHDRHRHEFDALPTRYQVATQFKREAQPELLCELFRASMARFLDSTFWQRMVIPTSYHEPAILHAITAIGALHESSCNRHRVEAKSSRDRVCAEPVQQGDSVSNQQSSCGKQHDFSKRSRKTPIHDWL